jgi:FkbM family methyltransferase
MFISFEKIIQDHSLDFPLKGVIHIGAHLCEEHETYNKSGVFRQIWIEGNPRLHEENRLRFDENPFVKVFCEVISDVEKPTKLFLSNATMSSSILQLKEHKQQFPGIGYIAEHVATAKRIDTLFKENELNIDDYNFVNLDIQGAELLALKSFGSLIKNVDYIYTEINTIEMYDGCVLLKELDNYLAEIGFERVEIAMYEMGGWGDALYLKKKI